METELRMISVDACLTLLQAIPPFANHEIVSLTDCLGRILAVDVLADTNQPPFDKSAMDGYACRREDLPGPLTISGLIAAGTFTGESLKPGHCFRIFTGAALPQGADCVIMQEYTIVDNHGDILFNQRETKNNICYKGEDIKKGEIALKAGTLIQPQHIAVLASLGQTQPVVFCKPRIAIISSGSELVEPDKTPEGAMIRNSNAYQLIGQVKALGCDADYLGIIADNQEIQTQCIENAVGNYDLIIMTGGASVGDYDFMPAVLASLDATVHFSALNIQPGKPCLLGTIGKTHVLGLSGNPVSSYLQFMLVAKPLILILNGYKEASLKIVRSPLISAIKRKKGNRQLYIPVSMTPEGVSPVKFNGSAHINALNEVDGFAVMNVDVNELSASELVYVILI